MANFAVVKPLVESMLHLKDCDAKPSAECKECVAAATRLSGALSESMEVAGILRRWQQDVQNAMPRPDVPTPSPGGHQS